ncbi:MAG TPA: T9SS type A sorting domain-containing protein [Chryseolinea sp.]|nr:T9SS type A sorting domain-containing protein [Chryseolinea sp.]
MKFFKIVLGLIIIFSTSLNAQTNTTTSGTWSDASVWSAGVPGTGTITANINHPLEVNANIAIGTSGTGVFNIFQSVTDFPGGTSYTLEVGNNGTLDVQGGTSYFNAAASPSFSGNNSVIRVRSGATLILNGDVALSNGTNITIDAGGTLIINGTVNSNIQAPNSFIVEGTVQINGSYNSSGDVDVIGNGEFFTTGGINTTGGPTGTVFGSPNNCGGPCSGRNLCFPETSPNNVSTAPQYLCSGESAVPLVGDAIAGATFQWQSSTTSATTNFQNITDAAGKDYAPVTPSQTTWYRRVATLGGCTGPSNAKAITILQASSWNGRSSINWDDVNNWCGGVVPTIDTDVVIPAGILFPPTVSSATTALCRNLTIDNGATLTVSSPRQINVSGNLTNNGILTVNGNINFNGATPQTIGGSGFGSYFRIIVNNTSGATPALTIPSNGLNITTSLVLTSGKVDLSNANLTVGTTAGSVLTYTGGWVYNGNLTRWLVGALTVGATSGHFPVGTSTDYRPVFFGNTSISTVGTIRVSHTAVNGSSSVAFTDNGVPVEVRSNSFWTVATGGSLATSNNFSIRTQGTGLGTVGDVTHLTLTQVGSAAFGTPIANGGTVTNPQVNRSTIPLANLTNNFYWGSINGTITPLPVELISFTAALKIDIVELNWSTASEFNNDHFTIERSTNLENFEVMATIPGNGTTKVIHRYNTLDPSPVYGRSYYRLKQTDFDGNTTYSDMRVVDYEGPKFSVLTVYPNPLSGSKLTVVISGLKDQATVPVMIYNVQGQLVFEQTFSVDTPGTFKQEIELTDHLSSGLYIIKSGPTLQLIQRLVIE